MIKVNEKLSNVPVKILMRVARDTSPLFALLLERHETDDESIQKHMANIADIANTLNHILIVGGQRNKYEEQEIFTNCINLYCDCLSRTPVDQKFPFSDIKSSIINFILSASKLEAPAPDTVFENHDENIEMILTRSHIMVSIQTELDFYSKSLLEEKKDRLAVFGKYTNLNVAEFLTDITFKHGEDLFKTLNITDENSILTRKSILKGQLTKIVQSMIGPAVKYALTQTEVLRRIRTDIVNNVPENQRTEKTKSAAFYESEYNKMKEKGLCPPFVALIDRELPKVISKFYQTVSSRIETENKEESRIGMK